MKRRAFVCTLMTVALAVAAVSAQAAVVTVTPENMGGWSIETSRGAVASLANYGYAVAQRPATINNVTGKGPWTAEDGTSLGQGAYYATLAQSGYSTAWLGLDTWNGQSLAGVALNSITRLEYYALNAHMPSIGSPPWDAWTYWQYSRQPIQLQITAQSPDGTDRKQFWFLPWEPVGWDPSRGSFLRGDKAGVNTNKWCRYDCINFNNPGPYMAGYWYCPDPEIAFKSWNKPADAPDTVISQFGNYTLVSTSNDPYPTGMKSAGWDGMTDPPGSPLCTGTGRCINFEVGARKGGPLHLYLQDGVSWETDFQQFRGYVDRFTLGIDGTNETYDFEPSAAAEPPQVVCMNIKSTYSSIVPRLNQPQPGKTMVKIVGEVAARGNPRFWVDDPYGFGAVPTGVPQIVCYTFEGDPMKATNNMWPNPTFVGDFWSVTGILERPVFEAANDIWPIWSKLQGMTLFY